MKNLILLRDYNSYFNRTIKINTNITLRDFFLSHPDLEYEIISNANFNPNDFVNTEQIINFNKEWCPDYVLVVGEETDDIESGWFVLESQRTRLGQFRITLKRDVVNDYYEFISEAPAFIEKATIPPTDSAIYNSEGMSFNQIKQKEYLLQDETKTAWIVGYMARPETQDNINIEVPADIVYDQTLASFPLADYIADATNPNMFIVAKPEEWTLKFNVDDPSYLNSSRSMDATFNTNLEDFNLVSGISSGSAYLKIVNFGIAQEQPIIYASFKSTIEAYFHELQNAYADTTTLQGFSTASESFIKSQNGKILFDTVNNKYYKVIVELFDTISNVTLRIDEQSSMGIIVKNILDDTAANINANGRLSSATTNSSNNLGFIDFGKAAYQIKLEELKNNTFSLTINAGRRQLRDAPYDMFCIPYGNLTIRQNNQKIGNSTEYFSLKLAQAIAAKIGNNLYDLQLLPYCPRIDMFFNNEINITTGIEGQDYSLLKVDLDEDEIDAASLIIWCDKSSGELSIPFNYMVQDIKVENECDVWRLCSPNYQGIFEFSMAKNKGLTNFNVDYTYKPYNPYIHIAPEWNGLYGQDFNDARGLILGGDFSIATTVDAFAQYEINNKNYQNIFDRQIKNMDINRKYQVGEEVIGAISGVAQGAAVGSDRKSVV